MKKLATGLGIASLISLGAAGYAIAQSPMDMMQCTASCNQNWNACLTGGTSMTMASTPQEGMDKMTMNAQNATACGQQVQACYSSCMGG